MVQNGFTFAKENKSLNESLNDVKNTNLPRAKKVEMLVKLGLSKQDITRFFHAPVALPKAQRLSYTFGVEIECIAVESRMRAEISNKNVPVMANVEYGAYTHQDSNTSFKFVRDGSLSGSGFATGIECVSPVSSGTKGFAALKNCVKAINDAGAKVNKTCGLHVHIGAVGLTDEQYINIFKNYKMLEVIIDSFMAESRRGGNATYAHSLRYKNFDNCISKDDVTRKLGGSRYYKVNPMSFQRHGTVEFRQHQGTTNYKKIEMWVKFCAKLVNYSKENVLTETVQNVDDIPFLNKTEKAFFKARRRELND